MKSFKTSVSHMILQGLLLLSLIVISFGTDNIHSLLRLPVLLIVDVIVLVFFISSFFRKVIIDNDILTVKSFWRNTNIDLSKIDYVQALSAFGRWVVILNDGKRTAVLSSLTDGLDEVCDIVRPKLPDELKDKLDNIDKKAVRSKKLTYNSVLIMLICIVWFGIIKSLFGF